MSGRWAGGRQEWEDEMTRGGLQVGRVMPDADSKLAWTSQGLLHLGADGRKQRQRKAPAHSRARAFPEPMAMVSNLFLIAPGLGARALGHGQGRQIRRTKQSGWVRVCVSVWSRWAKEVDCTSLALQFRSAGWVMG